MEIESQNGSKIKVEEKIDLGRGLLGFHSSDKTVSRRHISLTLNKHKHKDKKDYVDFHVIGKNPIWVRHSTNPNVINVYKTSQQGHFNTGDSFCLSSKHPIWFHFNTIPSQHEDESNRYNEAFADDHHDIDTDHVSDIDPIKEFNFVVLGHEFDCYSKKLIRDIRDWNWFLEEPSNEDSDEEGGKKSRKKRKKGGRKDDDNDDVWTGESEEDAEVAKKLRNDPKPKYSTRSKDKGKKGAGASKSAHDDAKRKGTSDDFDDDDEEEDDEGDETLGGFIVDDVDIGEGDAEDDEEEEFEEDEDDE